MFDLLGTTQDVVVIVGNQQITGKDMYLVSYDLSISPQDQFFERLDGEVTRIAMPQRVMFNLSFQGQCTEINELGDFSQNKIRNKRVGDCNINELLFAVRKKISRS